ncbi:MAG TPA: DUF1674 domain-containing protein [Rhizomicrobium sp.]
MSKASRDKEKRAEIAARIQEAGARAKAEAEKRQAEKHPHPCPKEIGGADGPEPTRFGDWERKGVISDF